MRNRVIDLNVYDAQTARVVNHMCFDDGPDFPGGVMAGGYRDGFAAAHGLEVEDDCLGTQERYRLVDPVGVCRYVVTIT